MMKKIIKAGIVGVVAAAVALLIATAFAVPEKSFEVSVDTGLEVLSVYMCYEPKEDVREISVRFSDALGGYGYSNYVDGKLWISIAAAEPIDCSKPLAYITATDSDGSDAVPEMDMTLLKINGRKISDTEVGIEQATARRDGGNIAVSVKIRDELLRKGITLYAASYDGDGKMVGVAKKPFTPESAVTDASVTIVGASDAGYVRVMLLSDTLKPYAESVVIEEITED